MLEQFASWIGEEHFLALLSPFAPILFVEFVETLWSALLEARIDGVLCVWNKNARVVACDEEPAVIIIEETGCRKSIEVTSDGLKTIAQRMNEDEKKRLAEMWADKAKGVTDRLLHQEGK